MNDKIKLRLFSIVCVVISIAALAAGVRTGDGMYLFLGGMGLLGVALLAFAVMRRGRRTS
ncbi:hypothetical protein [Streptomyces sp. cmx-18-6]|uniref:hypothetical protein n=1 Tax=Streptomyces sp. cmx-18-6 TaxID=2790930 RepID=UPI00397EEE13